MRVFEVMILSTSQIDVIPTSQFLNMFSTEKMSKGKINLAKIKRRMRTHDSANEPLCHSVSVSPIYSMIAHGN